MCVCVCVCACVFVLCVRAFGSSPSDGPSFTTEICPNREHVIEFFNNTAHSNSQIGLRVYPHWTPMVEPCDGASGSAPQYLFNLTSFRNGNNGIFHRNVGDVHSMYPHLIENGGDAFFWKKFSTVGFKNESMVQHALIVGHTDANANVGGAAMFSPQDEYWIGGPLTIVNFKNSGALRGCADVRRACDGVNHHRPTHRPPPLPTPHQLSCRIPTCWLSRRCPPVTCWVGVWCVRLPCLSVAVQQRSGLAAGWVHRALDRPHLR
jgi:hypothetical protein